MNKSKPKCKSTVKPTPVSLPGSNQLDEPITNKDDDEFDIQLNWCLTNLKSILRGETDESNKKIPDRKVAEAGRVYNSLINPKTPFIKKRQLMANYFGDYRKQMAKEEEKFRCKSGQLKISDCSSKLPSKPLICKKRDKPNQTIPSEPFKFNFPE